MGAAFLIVNPDKGQYLDPEALGMNEKIDGLLAGPLPEMLVWLLAVGAPRTGGSTMRGSWAGDRLIVAGDGGPAASVWERAYAEYQDITVDAFETLAADSLYVSLKYEEAGLLDEDGRFIPDWTSRQPAIDPEKLDS